MKKIQRSVLVLSFVIALAAAALIAPAIPVIHAEDNPFIVLDDKTPSVDVVVTPDNGAPGVVYVELQNAHLQLTNSANAQVLSLADRRVTMVSFQLAQGAQAHTLRLDRLPGVTTAQVKIAAQTAMPPVNASANNSGLIALNSPIIAKAILTPAVTIPMMVTDKADMLSVRFPKQDQTLQLSDSTGTVILTAGTSQQISGLALRLAPGKYSLNVVNRDLSAQSEVTVSLSISPATTITAADLAAAAGQPGANVVPPASTCAATVQSSSVALRSGPGTAYTLLGYTTKSTVLPVGGINKERNWLLVQSAVGSAWLAGFTVNTSGDCANVTAYDTPLRNAVKAPVVVITQTPQVIYTSSGGGGGGGGGSSGGGGGHDDHGDGGDHGGNGGGGGSDN